MRSLTFTPGPHASRSGRDMELVRRVWHHPAS
jgi:hypothetical protein